MIVIFDYNKVNQRAIKEDTRNITIVRVENRFQDRDEFEKRNADAICKEFNRVSGRSLGLALYGVRRPGR